MIKIVYLGEIVLSRGECEVMHIKSRFARFVLFSWAKKCVYIEDCLIKFFC